jgi:hypothetical protein
MVEGVPVRTERQSEPLLEQKVAALDGINAFVHSANLSGFTRVNDTGCQPAGIAAASAGGE